MLKRFDVLFRASAGSDEAAFALGSAVRKRDRKGWVSVRDVLSRSASELVEIVDRLATELELSAGQATPIGIRLGDLWKVQEAEIPVSTVTHEIEEVAELFSRVNSAGTRIREGDITLALVAAEDEGWARSEFLPFVEELEGNGYDLGPAPIMRSLVAIGISHMPADKRPKNLRLQDVPRGFWKADPARNAWRRTKEAWRDTIKYLAQYRILSDDVLPSKNALIPLVFLADRHPDAMRSGGPLAWLLHATRANRYIQAAITTIDADVRLVLEAPDGGQALESLRAALSERGPWEPFTKESFRESYRDRFFALYLYLLAVHRNARDWQSNHRLGFSGTVRLSKFSPEWHHIFPREYLRASGVDEGLWDSVANIAALASRTNKSIGAKSPDIYLSELKIEDAYLDEQLIPLDRSLFTAAQFVPFLDARGQRLADEGNRFFETLQ